MSATSSALHYWGILPKKSDLDAPPPLPQWGVPVDINKLEERAAYSKSKTNEILDAVYNTVGVVSVP